jgi:hypothetical protein
MLAHVLIHADEIFGKRRQPLRLNDKESNRFAGYGFAPLLMPDQQRRVVQHPDVVVEIENCDGPVTPN